MKTVITICGSGRHRVEIFAAADDLRRRGFVVLSPPLHNIEALVEGRPEECRVLAWKGATFAHLNRIEKADIVFIVNPAGYVGASTTLEIGYAVAKGKLVVAMLDDKEELMRTILFDIVLGEAGISESCEMLDALARDGHA